MAETQYDQVAPYRREVTRLSLLKRDYIDSVISSLDQVVSGESPVPLEGDLSQFIVPNARPLLRILRTARDLYSAITIREWPYIDPEFSHMHPEAYDRWYLRYPIECARLHFFTGEDGEELCRLLTNGADQRIIEPKYQYHGCCVLKPTPASCVGRTSLRFREGLLEPEVVNKDRLLPTELGGYASLDCGYRCVSHIANARFETHACEFLQQDPHLGRCATAAVWMTSRPLSKRFCLNSHNYATITKQAVRGWKHDHQVEVGHYLSAATDGLTVTEISNALAETGARPLPIRNRPRESAAEGLARMQFDIFSLVESGFPVIASISSDSGTTGLSAVGSQAHAVQIVGSVLPEAKKGVTLPPARNVLSVLRGDGVSGCHRLLSQAVQVFYANDDSYGPYTRLFLPDQKQVGPRLNSVSPRKVLQSSSHGTTDGSQVMPIILAGGGKRSAHYLCELVTAVPPQVRLTASRVLGDAMTRADSVLDANTSQSHWSSHALVWRAVLLSCAEFKQSLSRPGVCDDLRKWYATRHLPRYVWVLEFSIRKLNEVWKTLARPDERSMAGAKLSPKQRCINGEFLYDATLSPWEVPSSGFVCGRFQSRCFDSSPAFPKSVAPVETKLIPSIDRNALEPVEAV